MNSSKSRMITFCGLAIAVNIVLGIATNALKLPLYLDTLGTVNSSTYGASARSYSGSINKYNNRIYV